MILMPSQLSGLLKMMVVASQKKGVRLFKIPYLPAQVRPGAREPIRAASFRLEAACCRTEPAPPLHSGRNTGEA